MSESARDAEDASSTGSAAVAGRVWQGYLSDDGNHLDEVNFTDKETAMEHVIASAKEVAFDTVTKDDFEQISERVWRVELSGPYNGVVVHSAVYSEVPA